MISILRGLRGSARVALGMFLVTLLTVAAFGQEQTGSVEGTVSDASGARIPGAAVKVEGAAFTRTVTTDSHGFFRMLQVPPGVYKVIVTADKFTPVNAQDVAVVLGKTTPIEFALKVSGVAEQVVVTGDDVTRIDPTDNKVQTNITQKTIDVLPKGNNMTSLLKLSPATRPESKSGQLQVDGASGSENSFMIDGLEVSNFRTGILNDNNNLPFAFIQEVQIKNSGFEAEFGGATGGVINVVTKSGTNEFHGEAGIQLEPDALFAGPRPIRYSYRNGTGSDFIQINKYLNPEKDDFTNYFPSFAVQGPVVKDRLFFFTSYSPQIYDRTRTVHYFDSDPRETAELAQETYHRKIRQEYFMSRLEATPFSTLRLTGTYLWNPYIQEGTLPSNAINMGGTDSIPKADFGGSIGNLTGRQLTDRQGGRRNATNVTFQSVWTPKGNLVASFRFSRGFLNEKLNSYFIPRQTRYRCRDLEPPSEAGCDNQFNPLPGGNNNIDYDVSIRRNFEGDLSYLLNGFAGRHEFKGGYQYTKVSNDVSSGYASYGIIDLYYGQTISDRTGRDMPVNPNAIGAGELIRLGTTGSASNRAHSIYIQDRWQPINRLTINAGFRMEKENLPSFNGFAPPINFGWGDKIVPRIGVAYDVTGNGKTKAFFSFGRFTDRLKFELPRGSFGGNFYRIDYFEILPDNPRYDYLRWSVFSAAIRMC